MGGATERRERFDFGRDLDRVGAAQQAQVAHQREADALGAADVGVGLVRELQAVGDPRPAARSLFVAEAAFAAVAQQSLSDGDDRRRALGAVVEERLVDTVEPRERVEWRGGLGRSISHS